MNDTDSLVRFVAALGQSVPREKRPELFAMLSAWLVSVDSKCPINVDTYFRALPSDTRRDVDLVQQSLTELNLCEALTLLQHATSFTNAIETILEEQRRFENIVEYVTTQPDYLRQREGAGANAPLWGGTLMDAIRDLISSAEHTVDIINPYWSEILIDRLLSGFSNDRVRFRVLTVLDPSNVDRNSSAIYAFIEAVHAVGSSVTFYSPTPEEISSTDAVAPIHAKVIVRDGNRCYIGSANLSKGGLETGLEIGTIHSGPCVSRLVRYCDWIFDNSERVDLDY